MTRSPMLISKWWLQGAVITYLVGFTILGILAYLVYADQPPIPARVVAESGRTVFTREDVFAGMNAFERFGLMELGSIYGHGAYLGPDFTADYLHRSSVALSDARRGRGEAGPVAGEHVAVELHRNTYDAARDEVEWSDERAAAHDALVGHYLEVFEARASRGGVQANLIPRREDVRVLTAFFAWSAWTATANRPGKAYSYTNNWPPDALAGNTLTADAVTWSVVSIIALLGGMGVVLFLFGRYDWLGWTERSWPVSFRDVSEVGLTPGQRATIWFLAVASLLFLLQTFVGGVSAHYRAEPGGFFGWDLARVLPYNIARTWHVQLSILWVSTSYLAAGIFIAPIIAGREPRHQGTLAMALLVALAVVVVGSLAGEYASIAGFLDRTWYWLGHQGWEYLDLGRVWQILLIVGLVFWVVLLYRGLRPALRAEGRGNLPWLLFYAALAIPAFYAVGLLTGPKESFVVTDFWRFWVVHLWVEDFLELFTTVLVAYTFVLLGLVREKTATRVIYLDVILYSMGGVVGTMHHLYFSGTPVAHMALGATFSAMEVIPLLLLTLEAWAFMRSGEKAMADAGHPHRWAVWFLISVGVWNFLGAGVFGFLINLPAVSYYEMGTNLTANHGHTAMMGVYGMLAVGLLLFCLRYLGRPDAWSDRAAKLSFWSLNIGLAWMAFVNLFPVGMVQLHDALAQGYAHARSLEFLTQRWVNVLEWLRLPGDVLFVVGGVLPLVWLCARALRSRNPKRIEPGDAVETRLFTAGPES